MKKIFVNEALSAATSFPITYEPKTIENKDGIEEIYLDMSIYDQSSSYRDYLLAKYVFWKD
jgi:hypothetical protein